MQRQTVQSSNIAAIGYDRSTCTLEVEFHNGRVYQYSSVPHTVHRDFLLAGSHGKFFSTYIQSRYIYVQM
jgi:hypothetical protein